MSETFLNYNVLLLAGATASGKSALAISIAKKCDAVIINADSMQVYADLHMLTARPSHIEMQEAKHILFGEVDGAVNYSVGAYLKRAGQLLDEYKHHKIIFVGGTGLYFKAMLEGLSQMPNVSDETRQNVRFEALNHPIETLHARLSPDMQTRLKPKDSLRVQRALEIQLETGKSIAYWQENAPKHPLLNPQTTLKVTLATERATLYTRINARFDVMMQMGAMDEVRTLLARNLDPMLPVMRAHGVPALIKTLKSQMSLNEAIEIAKTDTRNYAKRQSTWARNQMNDFAHLPPELAHDYILERF